VIPRGGIALKQQEDNDRAMVFDPSSPLEEIRKQFPHARVEYRDGESPEEAAKAAASADVAVVFADQYQTESADATSLKLPHGQDGLIESMARANRRTVVVLETGGPVLTPWLGLTAGLLEAWYPGQKGGQAIAEILSGAVNPSGHLPVSFPARETQLSHPKIDGDPAGAPLGPVGRGGRYSRVYTAHYDEGSTVGYRWFAAAGTRPQFPFGYGLSYTSYDLRDLTAEATGLRVEATAVVANITQTRGAAIAQFYVSGPDGRSFPLRLVGWRRIELSPGEKQMARIVIDPRLLANFDEVARRWRIAKGTYVLRVGFDAAVQPLTASFSLPASDLPP
jgi:beta-glucosidase